MGVDQLNLQGMDLKTIMGNFPIHTYGTYILKSSNYGVKIK